MTNSSRRTLCAFLVVLMPAAVLAQAQPARPAAPPPAPRPRPVIVTTPSPNEQFQRQVDRQQIENAQRQSQVRQQLQQNNLDVQRTHATDPALRSQLNNADTVRRNQLQRQATDPAVAPARASSSP